MVEGVPTKELDAQAVYPSRRLGETERQPLTPCLR